MTRLKKDGTPSVIPLAIERPSGLLVDALVEAGFLVTPIHPNVVKACRPRHRAVAAKSDPGDAFILADILRTDGRRLRPRRPGRHPASPWPTSRPPCPAASGPARR